MISECILCKYHEITVDWEREKFANIDIEWDYYKRMCRLMMNNHIRELCTKYNHPGPKKPQISPHKHRETDYGAKTQYTLNADDSTKIYD